MLNIQACSEVFAMLLFQFILIIAYWRIVYDIFIYFRNCKLNSYAKICLCTEQLVADQLMTQGSLCMM